MKKIKLLDSTMINQIAAGEVVERPLSIVKELSENSIDAGATTITIEIKDGGTSFIRITDNGSGIAKDDVEKAFLRHATSKIYSMKDLENVLSLGFRGEALSSISSVSQVEIITKTEDEEAGTKLVIHGEELISKEDIGSVKGTSIIVRNIFYNIPARRKFLKKPSSEGSLISDMVNKLALGNPNISFKYINNGSVILHTNGNGDLKTAIYQVYGKEISKNLIELKNRVGDFDIFGVIGKPEISRGNRKYENLFINGRYIKSDLIESAVESGYKTKLMTGKFPLFVLNIKIDPSKIDVNVHPTKLEVRFQNENEIYEFVEKSVINALEGENLIPQKNLDLDNNTKKSFSEIIEKKPYQIEAQSEIEINSIKIEKPKEILIKEEIAPAYVSESLEELKPKSYVFNIDESESIPDIEVKKEEEKKFIPFFNNYRIVGQVFSTYWIIEQNKSMYIIDQHAAHERVLFEKISDKLKKKDTISQKLLEPIVINVTPKESEIIKNNIDTLDNFGFEVEEFGENIFVLRSLPYIFNKPSNLSFFTEIIDKLEDVGTSVKNIYETKIDDIATIACKAAVKGNNALSYQEAKTLIEDILKLEDPFTCPHGRPTIIEISKYEMEKKFMRIV